MRVAVLAEAGVADSGLGLFQDVFTAATYLAERLGVHRAGFDVTWVGTHPQVRTGYGLTAQVQSLAQTLDAPPDFLLVPSLGIVTADDVLSAVTGSEALPHLVALHERGVALAAACNGVFYLAEAGLLHGRPATTSWWLGPAFRLRYPDVQLDETQALVVSDSVTTAGAALAHLDLALALVRRASPQLADAVGDYLAAGDRPQQGQLIRPSVLAPSEPILLLFDRVIRSRISGPLDIAKIAAELGVSQRTLQRLTRTLLGTTPVRYVQQVRLEVAVDLLRTTDMTVTAVARAVGYGDATTLGSLIRRRRGTTPDAIRRRLVIDSPRQAPGHGL